MAGFSLHSTVQFDIMHSLFKGVFALIALIVLASCLPAPEPKCQKDTIEEAKKTERALADFAINLYKNATAQEQQKDKNQVISPVSIALALALLENGAQGETRRQIQKQLVDNGAGEEVLSVYRALEKNLRIDESKTRLQIANAIFVDKQTQLKPDYEKSTKQCLESEVQQEDFQGQSEQSRQKINEFISQKTNKKISELFKKGSLDKDTKIVLANAIYFKAQWEQSFEKKETKKAPFYQRGRQQEQVPTMKTEGQFRHSSDDQLQVVELRYGQADISMYVLLPKQKDGIKELEQRLNGNQLRSILSRLQKRKVEVQLPKFDIRSPLNLKPILTKMGVRDIFGQEADLSRMSEQKLHISQAVHEAYIKVDEDGTEAAAATAFAGMEASAPNFEEPTKFIADHPFLYTIVHNPTGAVVFIGKVNEVQEKADE